MSIWHAVIHPITRHFRSRRGRFIAREFPDIARARICDLGGSRHFWEKLGLDIPPSNITIYNVSTAETGSTDDEAAHDIRVLLYDGEHLPVPDRHFDILICNSVLEHVAPARRAAFVHEMQRVAARWFCQTPAASFPVEPHFLMPLVHWLPRALGYRLVHVSPWRLLSRPDPQTLHSYWWDTQLLGRRELEALFPPPARIVPERLAGLTKSYYVIGRP